MKLSAIRAKAVVLGLLTDIVGSIVLGIALSIVLVINSGGSPANPRELADNNVVGLIGLAGALLSTALGGYVAARISAPDGAENALAVGLLSLSLGIVVAIFFPGMTPEWMLVLGSVLTVPAAMLGGWCAKRRDGT